MTSSLMVKCHDDTNKKTMNEWIFINHKNKLFIFFNDGWAQLVIKYENILLSEQDYICLFFCFVWNLTNNILIIIKATDIIIQQYEKKVTKYIIFFLEVTNI